MTKNRILEAIRCYRHWFDTCTRTLAPFWEEKACDASVRLDHAIDELNGCVTITKKEAKLIAALLEMAHDEFSNHGCNDTPQEVLDAPGFTDEEKCVFHNECEIYNSGDSEEIPHTVEEYNRLRDFALMGYFAAKLHEEGIR